MTAIQRIVAQMQEAVEGGAWHGPALLEVIGDTDAETAAAHPIPGAHSIWELVVHLTATARIVRQRALGRAAGLDEAEFWGNVPEPSETNWHIALGELRDAEEALRITVAGFPAGGLDAPIMEAGDSTAYKTFHGHIQHLLYHAGQIALLKKLTRQLQV